MTDFEQLPAQPAGWQPSPSHLPGRKIQRFWSGSRWTDELIVKGKEITMLEFRSKLRLKRMGWPILSILLWGSWILGSWLNLSGWILGPLFALAIGSIFAAIFGYFSATQQLKELVAAGRVNDLFSGHYLSPKDS